jgi:hypothetical protein
MGIAAPFAAATAAAELFSAAEYASNIALNLALEDTAAG